jgi:hypothetical protein
MTGSAIGLVISGWHLVAAIAGSSVVTTIGVYILARFTRVFDAYGEERAKLLAQFDNLDKLLDLTRELTRATEGIRAKVSDQTWDRQMRWTYKRDLYVRVIQAVGRLRNGLARLKAGSESEGRDPVYAQKVSIAGVQQAEEANDEIVAAYDIFPIVASSKASGILRQILAIPHNYSSGADVQKYIDPLTEHLEILRQEAQRDLGFDLPMNASAQHDGA